MSQRLKNKCKVCFYARGLILVFFIFCKFEPLLSLHFSTINENRGDESKISMEPIFMFSDDLHTINLPYRYWYIVMLAFRKQEPDLCNVSLQKFL